MVKTTPLRLTSIALLGGMSCGLFPPPVLSQSQIIDFPPNERVSPVKPLSLDIDPQILQNSPTLRQWVQEVPNVLEEIESEPSFKTRLRVSYAEFSESVNRGGISVGIEDLFLGQTGLTIGGSYATTFRDRQGGGVHLNYYLLPLGSYVNIAPIIGYHSLVNGSYHTDGANVGAKMILALSRNGAADISISQSFVSPGTADEAGLFAVEVGYALTPHLRLAADFQQQNSPASKSSGFSLGWEWLVP